MTMRKPPDSTAQPEAKGESAQSLAAQLGRLYGETLFGAWQDPIESIEASRRGRKRGRWGTRMAALLLLAAVAAAGAWVYRRGLTRRAEQDRAQVAKDVATFLADGELDRLAQYLAILQPSAQPLVAPSPYLDLIISAEAALYRYHDAAPERVARIAPHLSSEPGTPARALANLTLLSVPERAQAWDKLVALGPALDKNPEYHTVLASVLEQRGEIKAARAAWERSAQLGPLWLPHRYQQCAFEARQHNAQAAAEIAGRMAKVAPESTWTRMASRQCAKELPSPAGAGVPEVAPVAKHYDELSQVFPNLVSRNLASARPALGRALGTVHGQPPFVLDAFAALVAAKANDLAMEMTSYEAWPRENRWGQEKSREVQTWMAEGKVAEGVDTATATTTTTATATTTTTTTTTTAATATTTTTTTTTTADEGKKKATGSKKKKGGKAKQRGGRRRK
jgi:hypothetical protein